MALFDQVLKIRFLQRGLQLCGPFIVAWIDILSIDIPFRVHQSFLYVFEAVRFFADKLNNIDFEVPSLEQSDRPLAAWVRK